MLRKLRIALAALMLVGITLMLTDRTGLLHEWLGWMAKVQLLPAFLSVVAGVGIGAVLIVLAILLLTALTGRIYCSIICPLGIMQDVFSHIHGWQKGKKNRFRFHKESKWVRYGVLGIFVVLMLVGGNALAMWLAPYSTYARMIRVWWMPTTLSCVITVIMFIIIAIVAFWKGRWWCNHLCPVGTVLGTVSRYSLYHPTIDEDKCISCGLCEKRCKAECIDAKNKSIDSSRCVDCFDCMDTCKQGAISFGRSSKTSNVSGSNDAKPDTSRRQFLVGVGALTVAAAANAQHKVDGGLAIIEDKQVPQRAIKLKPAGSLSLRHFQKNCTGCQLCVSACPSGVLRPSTDLMTLMQPEMSFEKGYCDIACNECSKVCPAGAITPIEPEDKTSIQIGHAVWIKQNCVVLSDGVSCGNCARHCPVGAITMVETAEGKIPAIDTERCIGCGTCEYLCPSRPLSAIYVEGHEVHRNV